MQGAGCDEPERGRRRQWQCVATRCRREPDPHFVHIVDKELRGSVALYSLVAQTRTDHHHGSEGLERGVMRSISNLGVRRGGADFTLSVFTHAVTQSCLLALRPRSLAATWLRFESFDVMPQRIGDMRMLACIRYLLSAPLMATSSTSPTTSPSPPRRSINSSCPSSPATTSSCLTYFTYLVPSRR